MRIIHRLAFRSDSKIKNLIIELGIPFKEPALVEVNPLSEWASVFSTGSGICVCKIDEEDARWGRLNSFINYSEENRRASGHTIITEFTKKEQNAAHYLEVSSKWHHGYPEPSDTMDYLELTYNLDDYCAVCGVGKHQKAPFRFKKSPVWGQKNILQLYWIYDEYFVKPEIWQDLFEPFGIGCRPVVLDKSDKVLDAVVQLDLNELVDLDGFGDAPFVECNSCGRIKYLPITRGYKPAPVSFPAKAMFRSNQFFGSGASAHRMVLVSNEIFVKAESLKLKGVSYMPCLPNLSKLPILH